jgi:hypothetical protein
MSSEMTGGRDPLAVAVDMDSLEFLDEPVKLPPPLRPGLLT